MHLGLKHLRLTLLYGYHQIVSAFTFSLFSCHLLLSLSDCPGHCGCLQHLALNLWGLMIKCGRMNDYKGGIRVYWELTGVRDVVLFFADVKHLFQR